MRQIDAAAISLHPSNARATANTRLIQKYHQVHESDFISVTIIRNDRIKISFLLLQPRSLQSELRSAISRIRFTYWDGVC